MALATWSEAEAFCIQWGIDSKFNLVAPGLDKSIDQYPTGSIALYRRHFEFSNLGHPFSILVLNVLEYYRVSFGQLHPWASLGFYISRSFFGLRECGVDKCLISSMVTTLGSWKDCFLGFRVDCSVKMVWRHPDGVLNELEPSESELDCWFLKSIRACPSRLRPFSEHLLVLMGISKLWDKPDRDPILMRDGQDMHFTLLSCLRLNFIKSDNTSDVVFTDAETTEGDDVVVRGVEHRFEGSTYVNVPNVMGFTKVVASKASTRRSTRRMLKAGVEGKKKELPLVVGKESKAAGKKVEGLKGSGKAVEGSANVNLGEIYVPGLKVTVADSIKSSFVCEDVLTHFAHPAVQDSCSLLDDDQMIYKMILGVCKVGGFFSPSDQGQQMAHRTWHEGYNVGYEAYEAGTPKEKSSLYQPKAFEVFKDTVLKIEHLTYPYVGELKPRDLNEAVCDEVLKSLSKKRPCFGDSEETCSEGGEGSKGSSLEASEATGRAGRKKRKAKKTQDDECLKKDEAAKSTISDAAK
ncbi:hypothetical protein Hanom_Chr11g00993691 [Helianthus anomalus]